MWLLRCEKRRDVLPDINLNIGFFGARGVSLVGEVTDIDQDEVAIKQAMLARCVETVIMTDGGKWGQVAPYTFARFSQVSRLITTDDAPPDVVAEVRKTEVEVQVVRFKR